MASRGIDMTGWKMWEHGVPESRWEVISLADEKIGSQLAWNCVCSCPAHTKKIIAGGELRRGKTKSCGCYRKDYMAEHKKNDLVGQTFGELMVLKDSGERASDGSIYWICSCSCGNNEYKVASSELTRAGDRKKLHCNNSIHQIDDITGNTYGDLEVIKIDEDSIGKRKIRWWCKCHRCNREDLISIEGQSLKAGKTKTCGCGRSSSRGAEKIFNILQENNIKTISELIFEDLNNPLTGKPLRYDFGLYINDELQCIVEYDGEQHFYYQESPKSWNNKEKFYARKERDKIKNEYCLKNNIPLYRIPYWEIDNINTVNNILNKEYLVKSSL